MEGSLLDHTFGIGSEFIPMVPAYLSVLFNGARGIDTEYCGTMCFFLMSAGAKCNRFTLSYVISILIHLNSCTCSSKWNQTDISINIFMIFGMTIASPHHSLWWIGLGVSVVLALNIIFHNWLTYTCASVILDYYFRLPFPAYVVVTF